MKTNAAVFSSQRVRVVCLSHVCAMVVESTLVGLKKNAAFLASLCLCHCVIVSLRHCVIVICLQLRADLVKSVHVRSRVTEKERSLHEPHVGTRWLDLCFLKKNKFLGLPWGQNREEYSARVE